MLIKTKYENNSGTTDNVSEILSHVKASSKLTKLFSLQCLDLSEEELKGRTVDHLDIAFDEFNAKHYKREEDPKFFKSVKTSNLRNYIKCKDSLLITLYH